MDKSGDKSGDSAPQTPNQRDSGQADGGTDKGERQRRALGLTASLSSETPGTLLPDPYPESCLERRSETSDSLIELARHTFQKLSSDGDWRPTPIQLQSWPVLKTRSRKESSSKRDNLNLVAIATTGSGKTLSYSVPMVDSCALVKGKKSRRYVHGLVLVPTRELALQVSKTLKVVTKTANRLSGKSDKIAAVAIYGGVNRDEQIDALGKNSQYIVAATPLRLIDLLGIGEKDGNGKKPVPNEAIQRLFESTRYLVIDEADQMAVKSDMSEQVDRIVGFLREKSSKLHKECLFSATLPRRAVAKCSEWIHGPRATVKVDTVTVGKDSNKDSGNHAPEETKGRAAECKGPLDLSTIPAHITQTLHVCANHKKPKKLMTTINKVRKAEKESGNRRSRGLLIVFFGRIKTLQYVHNLLEKEQIKGIALHSQMNQKKRESQLNLFRSGKCPILLATDVAARGIHIKNVEYIINYDFPGSLEQYVHRCGRAGRGTVSGRGRDDPREKASSSSNPTVYSFFHRELAPMAGDVVELLRSCNAWIDPNLAALVPGGAREAGSESKRKRRKRQRATAGETGSDAGGPATGPQKKPETGAPAKKTKTKSGSSETDPLATEESEDEFAHLAPNRIVLKRASHVPTTDSEDESD